MEIGNLVIFAVYTGAVVYGVSKLFGSQQWSLGERKAVREAAELNVIEAAEAKAKAEAAEAKEQKKHEERNAKEAEAKAKAEAEAAASSEVTQDEEVTGWLATTPTEEEGEKKA